MKGVMILSTVSSLEDAERIAKHLVEKKLAACVNIVPGVTSFYFWKGELQKDSELILFIKTTKEAEEQAINEIRKVHPYEVPEILSLSIENGLEEYINWMKGSVIHESRGK